MNCPHVYIKIEYGKRAKKVRCDSYRDHSKSHGGGYNHQFIWDSTPGSQRTVATSWEDQLRAKLNHPYYRNYR